MRKTYELYACEVIPLFEMIWIDGKYLPHSGKFFEDLAKHYKYTLLIEKSFDNSN